MAKKKKEQQVDQLQEKIYELIQVDLEKLCREIALQLKLRKDREELVINAEKIMERAIKDDDELNDLVDHCISVFNNEVYDTLLVYCPFIFKQYTSDKVWDMLDKINPVDCIDVSTWAEPRRKVKDTDPVDRLLNNTNLLKGLRLAKIETIGELRTAYAEWRKLKIVADATDVFIPGVSALIDALKKKLDTIDN